MRHRLFVGVIVLALLSCAQDTPAAAALEIYPTQNQSFVGDSLTAGVGQGHWYDVFKVNADLFYYPASSVIAPASAVVIPPSSAHTIAPATDNRSSWFNFGNGGDKAADVLARIATVVSFHAPVAYVEVGVNDAVPSSGPATDPATFRTTYDSILAALLAGSPVPRIGCLSIFCSGEQYPDVTHGTVIDGINAQIQASCLAHGGVYFDVRSAQQAYEAIHAGSPPLTIDGTHPNSTTGIPLYSTTVQSGVHWNATGP